MLSLLHSRGMTHALPLTRDVFPVFNAVAVLCAAGGVGLAGASGGGGGVPPVGCDLRGSSVWCWGCRQGASSSHRLRVAV